MDLYEAEAKYLGKIVRHLATGLQFRVYEVIRRPKTNQLVALFEHPSLDDIPIGQQTEECLRELETHYTLQT